jgi:hypothetical protein
MKTPLKPIFSLHFFEKVSGNFNKYGYLEIYYLFIFPNFFSSILANKIYEKHFGTSNTSTENKCIPFYYR